MIPLAVSLVLIGLGILVWRILSNSAPAGTVVEIRIQSGKCRVVRGTLRPGMITDVGEIVSEAGVSSGAIWVTKDRRVQLSASIPAQFHQRLRNVLLNG